MFSMKNSRCFHHQEDVKGFFGTFDGLIWIDSNVENIQILPDASILNHEIMHYFQNFFTATGLSYFTIIELINRCLDDILVDAVGTVKSPLVEWLPSSGQLKANGHSLKSYDRIMRLLTQLSTASFSSKYTHQNIKNENISYLSNKIKYGDFKIDTDNVSFVLGNDFVFPIDYQAICESLALAQEMFFAASMEARKGTDLSLRLPLTDTQIQMAANIVNGSLSNDFLWNPIYLQYTFPFLVLLKSGYNLFESAHLIIFISLIPLFQHFIMPGVPEFGVEGITKFGGKTARLYTQLLQSAIDDKFLDILNNPSSPNDLLPHYMDRFSEIIGINKTSNAIRQFYTLLTKNIEYPEKLEDWLGVHQQNIYKNAKDFIEYLMNVNIQDGMGVIWNPQDYLHTQKKLPIVYGSRGFINIGEQSEEDFSELCTYSLCLHIGKCALLGPDKLFNILHKTKEYQQILTDRIEEPFSIKLNGWNNSNE